MPTCYRHVTDLLQVRYRETGVMDFGKTCYGEVANLLQTCCGEVTNLLRTCYGETGVMDFDFKQTGRIDTPVH